VNAQEHTIIYNPPIEKNTHWRDGLRWVENISDGLRIKGFADEVGERGYRRIDHRGWFLEDDGDGGEVARGIVVQLPGRDGAPRYIGGMMDPFNPDCGCLDFSEITDNEQEAASTGDAIAERYADAERDYRRAWRAGRDVEEKWDEAQALVERIAEAHAVTTAANTDAKLAERVRLAVVEGLDAELATLADEIEELHDDQSENAGYLE